MPKARFNQDGWVSRASGISVPQVAVAGGGGGGGYSALVLATAGLQSYWRLGEAAGTMADQKSVTTGAVTGGARGVAGLITGDPDNAYQCNGAANVINFGNFYQFSGTAAFTIEFIFTYLGGLGDFLVSKTAGATATGGWAIRQGAANVLNFQRFSAASIQTLGSGASSFPTSGKYHVAFSYDGTNMRIHKNGSVIAGPLASGAMNAGTLPLRIGANSDFGASAFGMVIDELAIYNVRVPDADLAAHAAAV